MNGTSQVPPPPGVPPKKGMSPIAWIGIGCVVILILCGIGFGVMSWLGMRALHTWAKNPTFTVKDQNGQAVTINASGAKDGKIEIKTDKGSATIDSSTGTMKATDDKGQVTTFKAGAGTPQNLPSWLPVYPGGAVQGTYDINNNEGRTAAFIVTSKDGTDKVLEFYESQLKSSGLKTEKTTTATNGQTAGSITGKSEDGKREATVFVSTSTDGTQAAVTFHEKK
jgi:hypothetical protein